MSKRFASHKVLHICWTNDELNVVDVPVAEVGRIDAVDADSKVGVAIVEAKRQRRNHTPPRLATQQTKDCILESLKRRRFR